MAVGFDVVAAAAAETAAITRTAATNLTPVTAATATNVAATQEAAWQRGKHRGGGQTVNNTTVINSHCDFDCGNAGVQGVSGIAGSTNEHALNVCGVNVLGP